MPENLGVEVVDLETRVVDMSWGIDRAHADKEALLSSVCVQIPSLQPT